MEELALELIETAARQHVILERNLSSMKQKYNYWPEFWKLVPPEMETVVGCDAHGLEELKCE